MIRTELVTEFLSQMGLVGATRSTLAGDASARRYERLTDGAARYILMDDPTGNLPSITAFSTISRHLRALGLSAPRLLGEDLPNGLILMEDLGDAIFARVIEQDPQMEMRLYSAAIDLMPVLHSAPAPIQVPLFDAAKMAQATDLAFLWYQPGTPSAMPADAQSATEQLRRALVEVEQPPVLALRDYHAENLIWMPDRKSHARVGLLDFQDAVMTHPIYDLVSLIRDARREVSPEVARALLSRFAAQTDTPLEVLSHAAALVAVQRNLRILGVFSRLSRQMGKPGYVDLIPRVWRMLNQDLLHPELTDLRQAILPLLPVPSGDMINHLRTPCTT